MAYGEIRDDGYFIELYFADIGDDASYAAGFSASTRAFKDLFKDNRRVALSGGRTGIFIPVSCGGSCAAANLWWEQNAVMYNIQIKLRSDMPQKDQERILVETANSSVTARRK